jgi:hypothetical protein
MIHHNQDSERHEVLGVKGEDHEKFENISQSRRKIWLNPTVAVRHSYFDCDISGAWLHVIGPKPRRIAYLEQEGVVANSKLISTNGSMRVPWFETNSKNLKRRR